MRDNRAAFQISADAHREGDVVLRDGSTVRIRVMRPTDEVGLRSVANIAVGRITLGAVLLSSE